MPWLRLWVDILDDPDLDALPEETCWAWAKLLAIAKRYDRGGELPDAKRIQLWMRRPQKKVDRWLSELRGAGLIDEKDGTLTMHGWARWQEPRDRTNAKRQARYRAAHPKKAPPLDSPRPETETEQSRAEQKPLRNAVTLPLRNEVTPAPPVFRSPEDQKQFDEAVSILSRSVQTQPLSMDLNRRSDLPEVVAVKGWQWLVAARVMGEGKAKKLTYGYLLGIARNATRDEFEDYARRPISGPDKPTPKIYGAIQGP